MREFYPWALRQSTCSLVSLCGDVLPHPASAFAQSQMFYKERDALTGKAVRFQGNTEVSIIGGGQTLNEITMYSGKEREEFRNMKPVFATLTRTSVEGRKRLAPVNGSELFIEWICALGSPCEASQRWNSYSKRHGAAPQYFFLLEVTTLPDETSYCKLEHRFIVRLVNLEIRRIDVIYVLVGTICLLSIMLGIGYSLFDPIAIGEKAWMAEEDRQ